MSALDRKPEALASTRDKDLGPQGPARVASGKSSLHVNCEGPLEIALQFVASSMSSSGIETGTSGFHSSADMDLSVPMEF